MSSARAFIQLPFLFCVVSASTTFNTNCTSPSKTVNFVSSPNVRGTIDILWASVFTLIVCTWTVQHLNIPEQRYTSATPKLGPLKRLKGWLKPLWPKFMWLLITLLLPEFLIGRGWQDLLMAWQSKRRINKPEWTITHAFFANMGGFVLQYSAPSPLATIVRDSDASEKAELPDGDIAVRSLANEEHFEDLDIISPLRQPLERSPLGTLISSPKISITSENASPSKQDVTTILEAPSQARAQYLYLNADQLDKVREWGFITGLPSITESQIKDMSKGDFFVKGTAVVQVLWLLICVSVRWRKNLPISQLEIAVFAFSVCAFITYLLCWYKPQDVKVATCLPLCRPLDDDHLHELSRLCGHSFTEQAFRNRMLLHGNLKSSIPNDVMYKQASVVVKFSSKSLTFPHIHTGMVVSGALFGSLHCLAWNLHFPTSIERELWRIASVASAALPPLWYAMLAFVSMLDIAVERYWDCPRGLFVIRVIYSRSVYLIAACYAVARLYIIVEIFRSLLFLPPEAFVGTWSQSIPHLG